MTMNFNRNGGSGTSDYSQLSNKPQINGVTLNGNKTSADLGLMPEYEVDDTPTELSENLISSGAVWDKLQGSKVASSIGGTIEIPDYGMTESIEMYFKPSQDLHGYSKPWAGGAGKNLYVGSPSFDGYTNISSWTLQDEKYNGHDVYKKSSEWGGTSNHFSVEEGIYTFSVMVKTGINTNAFIYLIDPSDVGKATVDVTSKQVSTSTSWTKVQCTFTVTSAGLIAPRIELGSNNDIYISEYQLEQGSTATSYEPYSNICPIVGQSEATFSWTDSQDIETARTMSFGNTYYGGVCHFDGTIYPDWDYIASYNGETLTDEWLSDRDEYTAGTTPTNGAEVVYKTTPTQVRVTPPANLNLTDDYPIEYNGYMANIVYQPKDTVLEEAKNYTNQEIAKLVPQVYSTSEEKVGTWIDGTTIYQKTIDCGALPNTTTKYVSTDIEASKIVKIEGIATAPQSGGGDKAITIPMPFTGSGGTYVGLYAHILANDKISIRVSTDADRSAYNGYITIQYTKLSN